MTWAAGVPVRAFNFGTHKNFDTQRYLNNDLYVKNTFSGNVSERVRKNS